MTYPIFFDVCWLLWVRHTDKCVPEGQSCLGAHFLSSSVLELGMAAQ